MSVLLSEWLQAAKHRLAPSTHLSYSNMAAYYLVPALGRVRLDKLTPARIQSGITDLLGVIQ